MFTFVLYPDYSGITNPAVQHDLVFEDSFSQQTFSATIGNTHPGANPQPPHVVSEWLPSEQVRAGPLGCPSAVKIYVFFSGAYVGQITYPGAGAMLLPPHPANLLHYARGYDYYLTLEGLSNPQTAAPASLVAVTGLTLSNFLAAHGPSFVGAIPHLENGILPTASGQEFLVRPTTNGFGVTFGVNENDLDAFTEIRLHDTLDRMWWSARLSISRGFGAAAMHPLNTPAERDVSGMVLRPNWVQVRAHFSARVQSAAPGVSPRRNTLVKQTRRTFVPGRAGSPGFAGSPATPARTITTTERVCSWQPDRQAMIQQGWRFVPVSSGFTTEMMWVPPSIGQGGSGQAIPYSMQCFDVMRSQFVPAQPAVPAIAAVAPVPAQTLHDFNLGWTGRARSIRVFPQNGRATFRASQVTGAVIGLSTSFRQTGFADIAYAFRLEHGVARIVEGGAVVASLGTYTRAQTFEIRRFGGRISYLIDGAVVRDVPNTSAPMHLDAVMFTGGDNIFDPSIQGLTSSVTSLLPLTSSGGGMQFTPATPAVGTAAASLQPLSSVGWATRRAGASGFARLSPLRVLSRAGVRAHTRLQPLGGMGSNRPYAGAATQLMRLTGQAEGELGTPAYSVASGALAPLIGTAVMQTGGLLSSASTLRRLYGLASDRVYSAAQTHLRPVVGYGVIKSASEMRELSLVELAVSQSLIEMFGDLVIVMTSTGRISGAISYTAAVSAQVSSTATATTEYVLAALLSANVISAVSARSIEAFGAEGGTVWVVNAETDAGTQYENFGFNSFAKIGGTYYGAKEGGVYALDGDTDDGEAIQSMIALGKKNFGATTRSHLMRLENCYMGVASDGRLVLKVRAEGKEHVYRTRASSRELQTQRVDIGRGLRANFMEFEIWNQNGGDFSLQSVEFAAVVLNRRI